MVDEVTVNPSTGVSEAIKVAGDVIATRFHQRFKLTLGADGVNDGDLSSANPMPAQLVAGSAAIGSVGVTSVVPGTGGTSLGKAIDSAAGATDTGVAALAKRVTTPAAVAANGDWVPLQTDDNGNLRVNVSAGGTSAQIDDTAFSAGVGEVLVAGFRANESSTDSVDEGDAGYGRMTLDRKQIMAQYAHTAGGWTPYSLICVGVTEDKTVVKNSPGQLGLLVVTNLNASPAYIKFYNMTTAPAVATDVPVQRYMIPANANGFVIPLGAGLQFTVGIAFVVVTGIADTNAVEVAANEVIVNLGYK